LLSKQKNSMVEVNQAFHLIENNTPQASLTTKALKKAMGFVLAKPLFSPINMPPFRQSAMDGYAIIHSNKATYTVATESKAGFQKAFKISENQSVRIFTGAYVPENADTVIMQENVNVSDNIMKIEKPVAKGSNVREIGEQVKVGDLVANEGTIVTEALTGFLATLGIEQVAVYEKPSVGILVTGNELVQSGKKLKLGQIYESNGAMLFAALEKVGIKKILIKRVTDNALTTKRAMASLLKKHDFVLVSGGISVGDYDFVKQAALLNKVNEVFYKVNQKPGKPLFYGKKMNQSVFALPGNPASCLTCFYVYVVPALRKFMGYKNPHLQRSKKIITSDFKNPSGKDLFLKAIIHNNTVSVLGSQSSAMLSSYIESNALIHLKAEEEFVKTNSEVEVIHLIL
jgi:molybdopterin molybdotransferase